MIFEAIEAMEYVAHALAVWLVIGAMVATIVLLSGLALGTWAVKAAWRAHSGPCGASDAPEVAPDVRDAPAPPEGRSSDSNYEEAA